MWVMVVRCAIRAIWVMVMIPIHVLPVHVVSNAVVLQSRYPEATIIVDAACTDSFDKSLHEKVLDVLAGFQVKVIGR